MKLTYCIPEEVGLASEGSAVAKRLGRLLTALGNEINGYICQGPIHESVRELRIQIIDKLKAEGWRVKATDNGYRVLLPLEYIRERR